MAARVSFLAKELDAAAMKEPPKLVVPQNAVVERNGAKMVYVADQGKVRLTNVQVQGTFGTAYVLKDGPRPGTKVVANPTADLRDGQDIKEKSN
jgi:HlyD family secretion protein